MASLLLKHSGQSHASMLPWGGVGSLRDSGPSGCKADKITSQAWNTMLQHNSIQFNTVFFQEKS